MERRLPRVSRGSRTMHEDNCERCKADMSGEEVSVEAFEISGQALCESCADEVFAAAMEGEE